MNTEVFDRAVSFIEAHPKLHNQEVWVSPNFDDEGEACGTAACLAGWIVILEHNLNVNTPFFQKLNNQISYVPIGDQEVDVRYEAARLLDITGDEADWLFYQENTIEDIKAIGKDLANGDPEAAYDTYREVLERLDS